MIYIGNHVTVSNGYEAMGREEISLGGDTFAFFPRNPRGGRSKPVADGDAEALRELMSGAHFGPLVVHGAYTMNLCSAKEEVRANSLEMIRDDLIRLQRLPGNFYNFHPGSHTGQGTETGIIQIADGLVSAIRAAEDVSGMELANAVLLETMTGKGSEIGGSFGELRAIIDRAEEKAGRTAGSSAGGPTPIIERSSAGNPAPVIERQSAGDDKRNNRSAAFAIGVCLDTCHIWDAGYDICGRLDEVLEEFDRVIGLDRLKAVHLNDSKNECGSRKDRHDKLGQGMIGADALRSVVRHPLLQGLPFILETPNDDEGYRKEISMVREWMV